MFVDASFSKKLKDRSGAVFRIWPRYIISLASIRDTRQERPKTAPLRKAGASFKFWSLVALCRNGDISMVQPLDAISKPKQEQQDILNPDRSSPSV